MNRGSVQQPVARADLLDLLRQGKLPEALAGYDEVLRAHPRDAEALHYSGVALYQMRRLAEALDRVRRSVAIDSGNADAWSNLGLVLQACGHYRAAVEMFDKAASLEPGSFEIMLNRAAGQAALGEHAAAESSARALIARDGTLAKAWFVLALALQPQGRMLEALDAATRAAGLAAGEQGYAGLKAQIETGIGAPERARQTLETALARHPMSVPLRYELAGLLENKLAEPVAAAAAYEQVLLLDPAHGHALSQLTFLRGRLADWEHRDEFVASYRAGVASQRSGLSPFALLSLPSTRAEQRRCAQTWTADLAGVERLPPRRLRAAGRLRIGYLSADFHSHATAFLTAGMFEAHDRRQFEVFAFSTGPDDQSPMRKRLEGAFDRFVDVRGRSPFAIADAIRHATIDILVDLKGHTLDATPIVLARRPAPIQVHYLGYPGTLEGGLVDFLIADPVVIADEHLPDYAETVVTLPTAYQVNDRARTIAGTAPHAELGLPDAAPVLCCFNQTYKINPEVFDAWAAILRGVPDAVLWLFARTANDPAIANLRREAHARGIEAARLVFAPHRPNAEYLALYRHADLFLDTWPYNAHTTASDALWAGCPLLTLQGETFAGRVGASLLHAVGMPELVTLSPDDYVARAISLVSRGDELKQLRERLHRDGAASALFDTVRTTRAIEAAYTVMAEQHRANRRGPAAPAERAAPGR